MSVEMSARSVSLRLHRVAEVTDLHSTRRLDTKLDMRPAAVSRRLAMTGRLTSLCVQLGRHASKAEPAFRVRLGALREACARLATLHGKANAVLRRIREQSGPPIGGYLVPDMEVGVSDRLCKQALPAPRPTDEQAIRRWLLDSRLWREGLLPLAQLGAGWTGAS